MLLGLEYAYHLKWYDPVSFNLTDYEHYENINNGDLTWIIPDKILAFSGPMELAEDGMGNINMTPEDYVPIFNTLKVDTVVRLNEKVYSASKFSDNNINHEELFFKDGSIPSDEIVDRFLEICENTEKGIAVHCKAGLGRTGTLIACYAMKHYGFPAAAFIGYVRLCRPGSILGPQ